MRKTSKWLLTALLTVCLGMGFIACDDDNDDIGGGGPTNEAEYKESQLGWDIITQLTSERTAPEGWEDMTFEPTIGKASDTDPYTRIVATNDLAAAAERFGGLIGLPTTISETTNSFTYNQQGMGKLIYQKGSEDGEYLAQVDVDLKQVPHLKKILYQTPEQMGNNGYFDGSAYYRFGDVVQDKGGYYWICVRPSFGPEGKEDSHWMCFSQSLPDENIKEYKTSRGITNYLPTGLGKSTEHMQNAAEMFYAMINPDAWLNSLAGGTPPKMFNDFSFKNYYDYHNVYFWKRVCKAWDELDLFVKVLGVKKSVMADHNELHMIYSGYSWWWTTSWDCTLYEATYKNGSGKKANMHDATYSKPTKDMHDICIDAKYGFSKGAVCEDFFGDDNKIRWFVRYKKGSELGGGTYNVKLELNGCKNIYVYNSHFYQNTSNKFYNLNESPEITPKEDIPEGKPMANVTKDDIGKIIGQDGKIYESKEDAQKANTKAVAMVVDTHNTNYTIVGNSTRSNAQLENYNWIYNGIAIALEDGNFDKSKTFLEDEYVTVENYDKTWNNSHSVKGGATWHVPNSYHWQRMMLPFGGTVIMTTTYLRENIVEMHDKHENILKGSEGFRKALIKVDSDLLDNNGDAYTYLMAGGVFRRNESSINYDAAMCVATYTGNIRGPYLEFGEEKPNCCRYVLTW